MDAAAIRPWSVSGDALMVMWIGVGLMFAGFLAKWTDRSFGLAQVFNPELFEWLGTWVIRGGFVVGAAGGVLWLVASA
jgi:hypothetical protein